MKQQYPHFGDYRSNRTNQHFDKNDSEHQYAEKVAYKFRSDVFSYASSIFKQSPKLLKQLSPKKVGERGDGLVLFSQQMPPGLKSAKSVLVHFLFRADNLIDETELKNKELLSAYIDNYLAAENL